MGKAKILIVDDSVVMRQLLRQVISSDPDLEVAYHAVNGKLAVPLVRDYSLDLVILDIEMPEMNGLETLAEIRKITHELPVIMFSTLTEKGASATVESLMLGATDYVTKPSKASGIDDAVEIVKKQLLPKVRALCAKKINKGIVLNTSSAEPVLLRESFGPRAEIEILGIGSSTGGPNALAEVISHLPGDLPVPVVITQHMPPLFTKQLADRLNNCSALQVHEAQGGEIVEAGHVWIAPGNFHLVLKRNKAQIVLELNQDPPENSCRPSVDVMFRSIAEVYGNSGLGIILTGMGQDGFLGSQVLVKKGSRIFAQDKASSVVWGMPGFVAEAGIAEKILSLDQIAKEAAETIFASRTFLLRK